MTKENVTNRLKRDEETRQIYSKILKRPGPLNKKNNIHSKDIFLLAFALGYKNKIHIPILSKEDFINENNFGKILPHLIDAIAINKSSKGIEILTEKSSEKYKYAEEYANGGLEILQSKYIGSEEQFIEELRIEINEVYNNKIKDKLNELDND